MSTTPLQTQVVSVGRDAVSRAVRQAIQALIPTLLVIAGGSTVGINLEAVATLVSITVLVSILKSAAGLKLRTETPPWARIAERAITAAAGTALGLVTIDGTVPAAVIQWEPLVIASVGSAVLAIAMFYTNPPVVASPNVIEDEPPTTPADSTFDPFPRQDGGDTEVWVVLGVATVIGVVLLLFGVSFK